MKDILTLLPKVKATTEELAIAKGKYYLSTTWKDQMRIAKQMRGNGGH